MFILKKFIFCINVFILLSGLNGYGQSQVVKGKITDSKTGETLIGVTVLQKGTNNGDASNDKGKFHLTLKPEAPDTLVISYIGYKTENVAVKAGDFVNIALSGKSNKINEVVVTALGIKRQKRSLGYSVQKMDSKDLNGVRESNIVNSMAGRIAGVQTTNGGSGTGSSAHLFIRGQTSLSGANQPLFVVDGVPVRNRLITNDTENDETGFQEVDYGNGASEISSDDIASMNILKGPGAAALYGSRAANGVVLIQTKDGSNKEDGISISVNSSFTLETPLRIPQYQNEYGQGTVGKFSYEDGRGGGINDGSIVSFGPELNGQLIKQFDSPSIGPDGKKLRGGDVIARQGSSIKPTAWKSRPNNVRDFFQTGRTFQNNVAISGANKNGSYRFSFSNLNNKGMIPNTDLKRYGISLSGSYNITDKLSTRTFVNYINTSSTHRPSIGYGSENLMYLFTWMGRQVNTQSLKDYWQAGQKGEQQFNYNYLWMDNPYFNVYENTNGFNKNRVLGNTRVRYQINKNLDLRLRSGIDYYYDLRDSKRAFSTQRFKKGAYREDEVSFKEINTDLRLTWDKSFNNIWDVTLSLGGNIMDQKYNYKATTAGQLSVPGVYNFENARTPLAVKQRNVKKRINSIYSIGRVGFKNRLFFDVTLRNDWSSTLPQDNNSFPYYSASLSSVMSDFIDLPYWTTYAKLRLSAASVGNDTRPFQLKNAFRFNQNYGSSPMVTNSKTLLNSELKPERLNALEAGGEFWFLEDRLGINVSVYQNISKNQIVKLPSSAASGYNKRLVNGGKLRSRGIEVVANATVLDVGGFKWKPFINFSRNRSHVLELPKGIDKYVTGFSRIYDNTRSSVFYIASPNGGRIGDMYGTGFKKVNGKILYNRDNGRPKENNKLEYLGNYNPDFIMGLGNDFSWKNFHFNFLFDWRNGGTIVSRTLQIGSTSGVLEHTTKGREKGIVGEGVENAGTEENPEYVPNDEALPASDYYGVMFNRSNEKAALYDASYLKLRQLRFSYTFPEKFVSSLGISEAQISFIGKNLLLFTENPHFDPELTTMQGRNFAFGVEDMTYPSSRSYGLKLKFNI